MADKKDGTEELDELGKEMEEALKNIGQDLPQDASASQNAAAPSQNTAAPQQAPQDNRPMGASNASGGGSSGNGGANLAELVSSPDGRMKDDLQFILDIPFDVTVEVGRSEMVVKDVVNLGQGSVIELDRLTGESLDVMINGRIIGHGEVVVVNDKFGLRLKKVITPQERIEQLRY